MGKLKSDIKNNLIHEKKPAVKMILYDLHIIWAQENSLHT